LYLANPLEITPVEQYLP